MQDSVQTIHRSAARFFSGTFISRISGGARDMAMAYTFGTDPALAAFMAAYRFAHLARRFFGEGSLQNTFIPHFEAFRAESPMRAFAFFKDLKASLLLILGFLIVLCSAFLIFFIENAVVFYTLLMLPSLFFISIYGLNAALLGCEKIFFTASIAPCAFNLVWIGAVFTFSGLPIHTAIIALSLSIIIACMAQSMVTMPAVRSILPEGLKIQLFSSDVKAVMKPLFLANFGVAAVQINNALDPLFALFANSEGPAWLWYAIRLEQLPLALFGIALANALTPPISRAIKSGNLEQFHHFFQFASHRTLFVTTLMTAAIFAVGPSAVNLLYGRGQFDLHSVTGTSLCLLSYALGLFPTAFILIAAPALFAFNDYKTPTKGAILATILNITLNSLFVFVFQWTSASIALATSIAAFWNAHYLSKTLKVKVKITQNLLLALFALSITWLIELYLYQEIPTLQLLMGHPLTLPSSFPEQLTHFLTEATLFCLPLGLYFGLKKV